MAARPAPLRARLQNQPAGVRARWFLRPRVLGQDRQRVDRVVYAGERPRQLLRGRARQAGLALQPRGPLVLRRQRDVVPGHPHPRRPQTHRRRLHPLHRVTHQPLVDAADLLHVERLVREPLALHHDEPLQHRQHRAVVERRRAHRRVLHRLPAESVPARPTLEPAVAVGVEQPARARRHHQRLPGFALSGVPLHAQIYGAKHGEQPRPRAEAAVHLVGVHPRVLDEPVVQRQHAQVLLIQRVLHRQQVVLFGVQQEDQPQQHREQAAVHIAVGERGIQRAPWITLVGPVEPGEEVGERVEDLVGQLVGDVRLPVAARDEDGWQRFVRSGEYGPPARVQQHDQRVEDGGASGVEAVGESEVDPTARLTVWGVEQAHDVAVRQHADRHPAGAQQPVELRARRVAPLAGLGLGAVEREARRQIPHQRVVRRTRADCG